MRRVLITGVCLLLVVPLSGWCAGIEDQIARLREVGREGKGNGPATQAWRELVARGPAALVPLLQALDSADATSANWLRSAVDAIAERELQAGRKLPADQLEKFIQEKEHKGTARRLAYEWLARTDPSTPDRLLPTMLDDPGAELRRDAVARVVKQASDLLTKGDKDAARVEFQKALKSAREVDQVEDLVKQLKPLGVAVDVPTHFGFIRQWKVIGPFDNSELAGFARVYPPEKTADLTAVLKGKKDAELRWLDHTTADAHGIVDLNKAIGKHMGAVAYAYTVVESPQEQPVEIRVGSNNAVKFFLNGQPLAAREEYHHGMKMDQYIGKGTLKAGKNELLVKVCQNEQTEEWAQLWSFQLRIADALGGAIPVKVALKSDGNPTSKTEKNP